MPKYACRQALGGEVCGRTTRPASNADYAHSGGAVSNFAARDPSINLEIKTR